MKSLRREVERVVRRKNCSGCGACAALFPGVSMELDAEGYLRPALEANRPVSAEEAELFRAVCPGVVVERKAEPGIHYHPIFGSYVEVWEGVATDAEIRRLGSSGGVITALSDWLLASREVAGVSAVAPDRSSPMRSVPVRIQSREDALGAAGSRYAPVAALDAKFAGDNAGALVGKPCEVAAACAAGRALGQSVSPLRISFFCAGTPSQWATESLVNELEVDPTALVELRYRGNGWPGEFTVRETGQTAKSMSYEASWGNVLGRTLQPRCKVCSDGTGELADISVGDYWATDEHGYPSFVSGDGNSVVIARTARGATTLRRAIEAGVLTLTPMALDGLVEVQPLQVERRRSLAGRLLARAVLLHPPPRYRGFHLVRLSLRYPLSFARGFAGTLARWKRGVHSALSASKPPSPGGGE